MSPSTGPHIRMDPRIRTVTDVIAATPTVLRFLLTHSSVLSGLLTATDGGNQWGAAACAAVSESHHHEVFMSEPLAECTRQKHGTDTAFTSGPIEPAPSGQSADPWRPAAAEEWSRPRADEAAARTGDGHHTT